jgi:hypothetical protein
MWDIDRELFVEEFQLCAACLSTCDTIRLVEQKLAKSDAPEIHIIGTR